MWSAALDAILTTLRYLAPATLLTLLWGQQSFIFKILKYIDSAFRSLLFSNEEQKQAVLQWVSEHGPLRVDELGTVWRNGWVLCGVLDSALPGTCAGHPPTQLSLKHAQAIAAQYLGVEPVFSRQELESNDNLSKHQEWRLITYIDAVREAVLKVSPSGVKSSYQKSSKDSTQFILDYIARGSGLSAAQINHPMYFNIYPTSQQCLDPGEITIVINGPNDTCGVRVLPPILGKAQLIRQQLLGMRSQSGFTENKLPLAHGATYLRNYGKNDMTKTFYIPKTNYDIDIEVVSSHDHVKIGYTAKLEGKHEIYITSKGHNIVGSPYTVTATKNILNLLEKDSFSLEDGEEIDIVDVKSDRKVVVRIVDFVTEKMLLKEDGVLEKISEDEAKYLMEKDTRAEKSLSPSTQTDAIPVITFDKADIKSTKFNEAANKIVKINKVCRLFNEIVKEKETVTLKDDNLQSKNHQDIPDVVNSTLGEATVNAFLISNKRDKVIVPENISVSILTEKISNTDNTIFNDDDDDSSLLDKENINLTDLKILRDVPFDEENESNDTNTSSNPFLSEAIVQDDKIGKLLGTFVTSEFETNKNQNEETQDAPIKIILDYSNETPLINQTNPFISRDVLITDRPKSPIFKDIANDSDYFDLHSDQYENTSENEFVNPFFAHQHHPIGNDKENLPVADFIIGAPVSLPPEIKSLPQETNIDSIDGTDKGTIKRGAEICNEVNHKTSELYCTSFETNYSAGKDEYLNVHSNAIDNFNNLSSKKEMRDSAYVSIDENNTLPDSNNNDNTVSKGTDTKQKVLNDYILSNMGPAEREIWENCTELQQSEANKLQEEIMKANRRDLKKSNFTPIVEENDKIISAGVKGLMSESEKHTETDPVTLAFAEINLLYNDYFPSSENDSTINEDIKYTDREVDQMSEYQYVKSASEYESDVMRHNKQSEGEISEIQANVTESVSVSQTLHVDESNTYQSRNNDSVKFGDITYSNIVLEKKKYWDEKIRLIEANEEETRKLQRKRRPSVKQLRHNESLSKRKGKQIIKKYLSTNDKQTKESENLTQVENIDNRSLNKDDNINIRRVKNWKTFWDSKLEDECNKDVIQSDSSVNSPLPNGVFNPVVTQNNKETKVGCKTQIKNSNSSPPVKQEIPEEVFKAFETSPKRFFGTSRKQILNKIDSSLGKPNAVKEPSIENSEATCESGLVSSRISLFHNISQTEELSWSQRKSQSMHNIYQRKDRDSEALKTTCKIESEEKLDEPETTKKESLEQRKESVKHITLKEKRARVTDKFYTKSFDESSYHKSMEDDFSDHDSYVKKTIITMNSSLPYSSSNDSNTHKMCSSKSEMDIFNKLSNKSIVEDFDKYKSYDELPKVSVKNFISLYEDVTKTAEESSTRLRYNKSLGSFDKSRKSACFISETAATIEPIVTSTPIGKPVTEEASRAHINSKESATNHFIEDSKRNSITESNGSPIQNMDNKSTYISLPDIDLEIIDKCSDKSIEMSPEKEIVNSSTDYKSRFKLAKQYFQSLEELREVKKPKKLNECELLLYNKSNESLNDNEQSKPNEKMKMKSHTMPSSEISKFWDQLQEENNENKDNKFMKISEKFHVEDFFTDVMEGRLSRQGSLRGIPHKKAVLEAFRSMENISDSKLSPYELAVSQFNDINEDTRKRNAQTYLNEYPYLPTTDPSNSHSRLDVHASGLIPFKELKRVRRNSVPDLRLNPSFTVEL